MEYINSLDSSNSIVFIKFISFLPINTIFFEIVIIDVANLLKIHLPAQRNRIFTSGSRVNESRNVRGPLAKSFHNFLIAENTEIPCARRSGSKTISQPSSMLIFTAKKKKKEEKKNNEIASAQFSL